MVPTDVKRKKWTQILEETELCENLCELLDKMFEFSPIKRISAKEALKLPYFDELRVEDNFSRIQKRYNLKDEFFIFDEGTGDEYVD